MQLQEEHLPMATRRATTVAALVQVNLQTAPAGVMVSRSPPERQVQTIQIIKHYDNNIRIVSDAIVAIPDAQGGRVGSYRG